MEVKTVKNDMDQKLMSHLLNNINRNDLRRYASLKGIRRGNVKQDLINNLIASNDVTLDIQVNLL